MEDKSMDEQYFCCEEEEKEDHKDLMYDTAFEDMEDE